MVQTQMSLEATLMVTMRSIDEEGTGAGDQETPPEGQDYYYSKYLD